MKKTLQKNTDNRKSADQIQVEFFEKLLDLCREYKVNMQSDQIVFLTGGVCYTNVDVNGGWEIKKEYEALTADRVDKSPVYTTITINGKAQ